MWGKFFNKKEARSSNDATAIGDKVITLLGGSPSLMSGETSLSTVYRCVDVISDSVASLPLQLFRYDAHGGKSKCSRGDAMAYMLNEEPDSRLSRFTFFKCLICDMLLKGNGYAWIDRTGGVPNMVYVESGRVSPIVERDDRGNTSLVYQVTGFPLRVESKDMIHVLNFSYNGLTGVSTLAHARNSMTIAKGAEQQASDFFNGSGVPTGIIAAEGVRITSDQRKSIQSTWDERLHGQKGGIVVLEGNLKYQAVSVNPEDAQLLQSRQYSVVEICRFFGVSPVKCFDLTHSSYSTVEATQLSFLTDTLAPILEKIELELKRKLFLAAEKRWYDIKFDTSVILKADKNAQANYYRSLVNCASITPNEVRDSLDLPPLEGGDNAYMQIAMAPMESIAKKEVEPIKKTV